MSENIYERALDQLRPLLRLRAVRLGALIIQFAVVGVMALRLKYFVLDPDIWWHLKVGDWIVDHLAVPHTGILSRTAANLPWVAYSWGYEVLLSRAYAWFGLIGIGVFGTLLTLAVACSIYWMLLRLSGNFWIAWLITWIVCWSFLFNGTPRPFFFSIALFAVTLTILFGANRSGRVQPLYWLPLIFWLWANLHIQFIYGLFLFGLFAGVNLAERLAARLRILPRVFSPPTLPLANLWLAFAGCILATLLGPYTYHPYLVVLEYSKAKLAYSIIIELQPLSFRGYSHFLELFIAASGFFAVGWHARADSSDLDSSIPIATRSISSSWRFSPPAVSSLSAPCAMPGSFACPRQRAWQTRFTHGRANPVRNPLLTISRKSLSVKPGLNASALPPLWPSSWLWWPTVSISASADSTAPSAPIIPSTQSIFCGAIPSPDRSTTISLGEDF